MAEKELNTECASCHTPLYRDPNRFKRSRHQFCCYQCRANYQMEHWQERLWAKVDKSPGHGPEGTCWVWTGKPNAAGYGVVGIAKITKLVHRVTWEISHGPIPEGLGMRHSCDNPPCCNPAHLSPGTQRQNNDEMRERGRANVGRGARHRNNAHPETLARGSECSYAKVDEQQVLAMRAEHAAGIMGYRSLAKKYGIDRATVRSIIKRVNWKHI